MKIKEKKIPSLDQKTKVKTYYVLNGKQKPLHSDESQQSKPIDSHNQLTWLENLVSSFQWYKNKNSLFTNETSEIEKENQKQIVNVKSNIKGARIFSQKKVLPNSKTKSSLNKYKNVASKVNCKSNQRKNCPDSSSNKNNKENITVEKRKSIKPEEIQFFGIQDFNEKSQKKQKRKPVYQRPVYSNKTTNIKATRRCLFEEGRSSKKKIGSIKKNKSMQMKQVVSNNEKNVNEGQKPKKQYLYLDIKEDLSKELQFNKYDYFVQNFNKKETNKKEKQQRKLNSSVQSYRSQSTANMNFNQTNKSVGRFLTEESQEKTINPHSSQKHNLSQKNTLMKESRNPFEQVSLRKQKNPTILEEVEENSYSSESDILNIFKKLDKNRSGILHQNNCQINHLSEEIKFIFKPIILKITHKNEEYDLGKFVDEAQRILDNLSNVGDTFLEGFQSKQKIQSKLENNAYETFSHYISSKKSSSHSVVMKKYDLSNQKDDEFYGLNAELDPKINHIFKLRENEDKIGRCVTFQQNGDLFKENKSKEMPRLQALENLQYFKSSPNRINKVYVKGEIQTDGPIQLQGKKQLQKLQLLNKRIERYIMDKSLQEMKKPVEQSKFR